MLLNAGRKSVGGGGVNKSIERWSERNKTWKDAEERLVFACESLEEREKWVFYLGMILEYFVTTL